MFVDFGGATFLCTDATGVIAEVVDGQRHVGVQDFVYSLAVVPSFGHGQQLEVGLNAVAIFSSTKERSCTEVLP
jgi:hypothetical protein